MGIITGLKNINEAIDRPKNSGSGGPRVRWLSLEDGQSVKIRIANEIDDSSSQYDESRGLAIVVSEHTSPSDYRIKAVCTMDDEGRCYGCELHRRDPKAGWRPRMRFYTNVVVDDGMEDPYVAVWSMGVAKSATFDIIREHVSEGNSLSNLTWKLKRNGKGTETTYILMPSAPDSEPFNWSKFDVFPLESAVRQIPYADQESYYLGFSNPTISTSVDW